MLDLIYKMMTYLTSLAGIQSIVEAWCLLSTHTTWRKLSGMAGQDAGVGGRGGGHLVTFSHDW